MAAWNIALGRHSKRLSGCSGEKKTINNQLVMSALAQEAMEWYSYHRFVIFDKIGSPYLSGMESESLRMGMTCPMPLRVT